MIDPLPRCTATLPDGRRCRRQGENHKQRHAYDGIEGETCTCMLRWYPNRCKAHPEENQ